MTSNSPVKSSSRLDQRDTKMTYFYLQ